jgi:hypothetical protein
MDLVNASVHLDARAQPGAAAERRVGRGLRWTGVERALSYLILVCGLFTVFIGARQILNARSPVPLWDEWDEMYALATAPHHQPPISWVWSQHNEHRIVFYRLLLLSDIHLFHGKHSIFFWAMLIVQCAFLGVVIWLLSFGGVRGPPKVAIIGLAAFCFFCPSQWENFGWAFQISFLLPGFFWALALAALLKYSSRVEAQTDGRIYLGFSILAACGATYSNGNGAVVWPLLLFSMALLGLPRRALMVGAVSGVAAIGLYLYHYASPEHHSSPGESVRHPFTIFEYVAKYLGVALPPWVRFRGAVAAATGGLGLLVALAVVFWIVRRPHHRRRPILVALLGILLFAVATAFITALGRISFGTDQAFASRYQTYNLLFWFALASSGVLIAEETLSFLQPALLCVTPGVMLAAMVVLFPLCLRASRLITLRSEAAATALQVGVPDKKALVILHPNPAISWRAAQYFRQEKLFMFSDPLMAGLNQPLSSTYQVESRDHCQGEVVMIQEVPPEELLEDAPLGAYRISGWAVDRPSDEPVRKLVISANGSIAGLAIGGLQGRTAGDKSFLMKKKFVEWSGLVRPAHGDRSLDVYTLDKDHPEKVCLLATLPL